MLGPLGDHRCAVESPYRNRLRRQHAGARHGPEIGFSAETCGFDLQAEALNSTSTTQQLLLTMLQNLLVERFQRFHDVIHEEPGFALVVAKNGPKLRKSASEEKQLTFFGPNGQELPQPMGKAISLKARKCSMSALKDVWAFAGNSGLGVVKTSLTGVYDFTLGGGRAESRLGLARSTGIAVAAGEGAVSPVGPGFRAKKTNPQFG